MDIRREDLDAIRGGGLDAGRAWGIVAPALEAADRAVAERICAALRGWTWKALDRRRRDPELELWVDLVNRSEALLAARHPDLAAGLGVMSLLLHESLAVAALADGDLLEREHVRRVMACLADEGSAWVARSRLAEAVGMRPAGAARLVGLLVDVGYVEEDRRSGEPRHRLSAEGAARVRAG